jgi:DNA-binding beta-propeller fold protein YncE
MKNPNIFNRALQSSLKEETVVSMIIRDIGVIGNPMRILCGILLLSVLVQGVFADEPCTYVRTWKLYEEGSGTPAGDIAFDTNGNVYVAETDRDRVVQYSDNGTLNLYWELRDTESGKLAIPSGIAVDPSRNVYFTERENNTLQKLTMTGKEVWGSEGTASGQFTRPTGIAVDSSGNVYVADTGNNRIQKIHSGGTYLLQWGSYGTADGAFNTPEGIAVDAAGQVYVADTGNSRIQKFSSDGTFLTKWGTSGTGNGQFLSPSGVAVDSWGNVYVADLTPRVQKFSPTGEYFTTCNTKGNTSDIAINPDGYLYVLRADAPFREIGIYGTASSIPEQTVSPAMAVRQRKFEITSPAVPTPSQSPTIPAGSPVTPTTSVTTVPATFPATIAVPDGEETIRDPGTQPNIIDRVTRFFRDLSGANNFLKSALVTNLRDG